MEVYRGRVGGRAPSVLEVLQKSNGLIDLLGETCLATKNAIKTFLWQQQCSSGFAHTDSFSVCGSHVYFFFPSFSITSNAPGEEFSDDLASLALIDLVILARSSISSSRSFWGAKSDNIAVSAGVRRRKFQNWIASISTKRSCAVPTGWKSSTRPRNSISYCNGSSPGRMILSTRDRT